MLRIATIMALMALALGACSTEKQSSPPRTATEQLLISTAADRAVDKLNLSIPAGTKVFVDASNFEGTDSKYAITTRYSSRVQRSRNANTRDPTSPNNPVNQNATTHTKGNRQFADMYHNQSQ